MVLNLDQAPPKYVTVDQTTLAKRSITATFAVSLDGTFVPMQLIYGRKTTQSLHKFKFLSSFSLSVNPTHYSNENEACKMMEEIIGPYVENVRKKAKLPVDQKALLTMYVFLQLYLFLQLYDNTQR